MKLNSLAAAAIFFVTGTDLFALPDVTPDVGQACIRIGSTVRHTRSGWRGLFNRGAIRGVVTAMDEASITLRPKKGPLVRILHSTAGSLEVSVGQRRKLLRGAIIGGIGVGLVAASIGAYGNSWCTGIDCQAPSSGEVRRAAAVGVFLGAALGAAQTRPEERWTPATFPPPAEPSATRAFRVDPTLSLKDRSVGVRVRLGW